jgi:hypothetical protein
MRTLVLVVMTAMVGLAQGVSSTAGERYRALGTTVFGDSVARKMSPGDEWLVVADLKRMVVAEAAAATGKEKRPRVETVRLAVESLQGPLGMQRAGLTHGLPMAELTETAVGPVMTLGFAVLHGPVAIPSPSPALEFFRFSNGRWDLVGEAAMETLGGAGWRRR